MATTQKLTPKLSRFEAWALALGGIVGWGSFMMPGTTFLPTAGPFGTAIAVVLGAGIMVVIALNLQHMMNQYPETGGAFIYTQKAFGRTHGYICGWFLVLAYLAIIPQNATALALYSRSLLGGILEVGPCWSFMGYNTYLTEMVLVAVVLALALLIACRSTKAMGIVSGIFAVCIVVGVAVIFIAVATSPFAYPANIQPPFPESTSPVLGVLGVLIVMPWAFIGFDAITQMGEDIKFSTRHAGPLMIGAILVGALIYIALNYSAVMVLPPGYPGWTDYLADIPNLTGLQTMPVFYAVSRSMGSAGLIVLSIAVLGAILSGIATFTIASTRLILAMAREKALPKWFGLIHPTYGTPYCALIAVFIASLTLSILGRLVLGWITEMSSVGVTIAFFYTSLATMQNGKREGKLAWQVSGAIGVVASVVLATLLLLPIEALNNMLDLGSYVLLIAWIVLGVNFYTPQPQSHAMRIPEMPDDFDE